MNRLTLPGYTPSGKTWVHHHHHHHDIINLDTPPCFTDQNFGNEGVTDLGCTPAPFLTKQLSKEVPDSFPKNSWENLNDDNYSDWRYENETVLKCNDCQNIGSLSFFQELTGAFAVSASNQENSGDGCHFWLNLVQLSPPPSLRVFQELTYFLYFFALSWVLPVLVMTFCYSSIIITIARSANVFIWPLYIWANKKSYLMKYFANTISKY